MKMKFCISAFLLIYILTGNAGKCVFVSDDDLADYGTFSGYVIKKQEWGPPNFGEDPKTDSRWNAVFLKLDHPVALCNKNHTPSSEVLNCVQIMDMSACGSPSFASYSKQHLTIFGPLDNANGPAQLTPITMDCQKLSLSPSSLTPEQMQNLKSYHCRTNGDFAK